MRVRQPPNDNEAAFQLDNLEEIFIQNRLPILLQSHLAINWTPDKKMEILHVNNQEPEQYQTMLSLRLPHQINMILKKLTFNLEEI